MGVESIRETLEDMSKRLVVIEAFDSPKKVLATVPIKTNVFVEKLKSQEGTVLISVTADNRESLPSEILRIILED